MSGDARQYVDSRVAVQLEVDDVRAQGERVIDGERKRSTAEFHRIDTQQQVMHDRVADQRRFEDVLVRNARLSRHVHCEPAQRFAYRYSHQRGAARIHHRVGDAAHQILAEADLRVHDTRGRDDLAAAQITQVRGDRRGTDVDCEAVGTLMQAGPDPDDLLGRVDRHGDLPRSGAQGRL